MKEEREMGEEVRHQNPVKDLGFAMIYHAATLDPRISDGALRTFQVYLMHAQQKDRAWPGQKTVARLRGKSERTIGYHNQELIDAGYISRNRRMGTSTLTLVLDYEANPYLKALARQMFKEREEKRAARQEENCLNESATNCRTDRQSIADLTGKKLPIEEEQVEEEQGEKEQGAPAALSISSSSTEEKPWTFPNGKHKGLTLDQAWESDANLVQWYAEGGWDTLSERQMLADYVATQKASQSQHPEPEPVDYDEFRRRYEAAGGRFPPDVGGDVEPEEMSAEEFERECQLATDGAPSDIY